MPRAVRRAGRGVARRARLEADWLKTRRGRADLAVFHEFSPPPGGGGHQFLRALGRELAGRGVELELNVVSAGTTAALFNSFNFDFARLRRFAGRGARMVHRVDGPIGLYRGFDDGTDARIAEVNEELAEATILQSRFSLEKHVELVLGGKETELDRTVVDALGDPLVHLVRNALDHGIETPAKSLSGSNLTRLMSAPIGLSPFAVAHVA